VTDRVSPKQDPRSGRRRQGRRRRLKRVATVDAAETLVRRFWDCANTQDWSGLAGLLAPELRYELPQTREFIDGAEGFVDFFVTWPQPWRVSLERVVSDGTQVAVQMRFHDAQTQQLALGFYTLRQGCIAAITEFWPEPYEPPARASRFVQRA
jgi:predicted ester cyclase